MLQVQWTLARKSSQLLSLFKAKSFNCLISTKMVPLHIHFHALGNFKLFWGVVKKWQTNFKFVSISNIEDESI